MAGQLTFTAGPVLRFPMSAAETRVPTPGQPTFTVGPVLRFPMTPRKRARTEVPDPPERAGVTAPTRCRHQTMTANESTPGDGQDSIDAETARRVARESTALRLRTTVQEVQEEIQEVDSRLRDGEGPTAEEVTDLRVAIDGLRFVAEEQLAELADGTQAWERDGHHRPVGELADLLCSVGYEVTAPQDRDE